MDPNFSPYGRVSTRPSPVNRMMADFSGDFRDGIDVNLGVGYVNERTIPAQELIEALAAVVSDPARYRQPFNYGGSQGSANLTAALRGFLERRSIRGLDAATLARKRMIVGLSGATSVLDALSDCLAPGIVAVADPLYYIYCDALTRKGFELLAIPEDAEGMSAEALESAIAGLGARAGELAFIYVVTVNNPSCAILSNRRRRALSAIAADLSKRLGRAVPIVFDLAYELLLHDPQAEPFESALAGDDLGIVYEIGTLSKIVAPALRIGYLLGPDGPLMNAVVQRTSDAGFSAPLFSQEMAAWFLENRIDAQLKRVNDGYREKAQAVGAAIDRELGPFLEACTGGGASFYYYLTFKSIETGEGSAFFRYLARTTGDPAADGPPEQLRPRVYYLPGEFCRRPQGLGAPQGKRQLRLSYGFEEAATIVRALALMREGAEYALKTAYRGV